jgi:serine/threonine protein kinase
VSLKELQLPSIASLRAIAALKSAHLSLVRPARIGLGFESAGANQKTLAEIEAVLGGPGRLSLPYSLRWLLDVLTGLGVLHRTLSFVHGEVQPEHIVLGEDGVGRLIPVVRAHWVRGEERSPERLYYLAPEKLLGDRVDVRSDVFSVGVMLWEALSGQRLLEAYEVDDIIARLMGGGIPRAHAPEGEAWTAPLSDIAERAIAVDPGRRFKTVAEMKEAIEAACSRYLASPPGMAGLFEDPARRARNHVRDSIAPDSQRVTVPPAIQQREVATASSPINDEAALDAAAERLSRSSFASIDLPDELEEELTTRPNAALLPTVRKGAHVNTLLGVPLPSIERDVSSAPDSVTMPFSRIPPSAQVLVTPLPLPPEPAPARHATPSPSPIMPLPLPGLGNKTLNYSTPPQAREPDPVSRAAPSSRPLADSAAESRRAASLSPLVAARPAAERTPAAVEPSFELVRPRRRKGALWLVLGAAVAIALFAARPWLARQVVSATGAMPDNGVSNAVTDAAQNQHLGAPPPSTSVVAAAASEAPRAVGIASTPAMPSSPVQLHGHGPREEHVVIHDSVEPSVSARATSAPAERKPEPAPPTPPPPAREAPPPPAPAPPKTKPAPVSDADRYGI